MPHETHWVPCSTLLALLRFHRKMPPVLPYETSCLKAPVDHHCLYQKMTGPHEPSSGSCPRLRVCGFRAPSLFPQTVWLAPTAFFFDRRPTLCAHQSIPEYLQSADWLRHREGRMTSCRVRIQCFSCLKYTSFSDLEIVRARDRCSVVIWFIKWFQKLALVVRTRIFPPPSCGAAQSVS